MMEIAIANRERKLFLVQSSILFKTKSLIFAGIWIKVVRAYGEFFKVYLVSLYAKANHLANSSLKEETNFNRQTGRSERNLCKNVKM